MTLCLRFCESKIGYWASRYIGTQRKSDRREEQEVIDLKCHVRKQGLTRVELYKVAKWKTPRKVKLVLDPKNTDDWVKKITLEAFRGCEDWEKLESLRRELPGIGQARASAILHLYDEKPYPILDEHALCSVNSKKRSWYPQSFWEDYIEFCRDIADRNGFNMRTLDRALWAYDYINDEP